MSSLKFSYWSSPHMMTTSGLNSSITRRASAKWARYTSRPRAAVEAPQSLPSSSRNGAGQAAGYRRVTRRVGLQRDRLTEPHRKRGMVVVGAVAQRVHEHVEPVAVQHQPRHDVLKFRRLKDDVELRDRMRPARLVAEAAGLDLELADNRLAQFGRLRLGRGVVINVGVIAFDFGHLVSPAGRCVRRRASPRSSC